MANFSSPSTFDSPRQASTFFFSYFILMASFLGACQNSSPPSILTNEGSEPKKEIEEVDPYAEEYFEYKRFERSNFTTNQIKENTVYVFVEACYVWETEDCINAIEECVFGETLTVISKSDHYYRDSATNAYGSLWLVEFEDVMGYVFSGFLSKLPFPKKPNLTLVEYGKTYLHLIDSVSCSGYKSPYEDGVPSEMESEMLTYHFEQGITITKSLGYETEEETIRIPNTTVEEGFYILQAFGMVDLFEYFDGRIPDYEMEWDYQRPMIDYMTGEAHINENGFLTFVGTKADGCGNWYYITLDKRDIVITAGGGC